MGETMSTAVNALKQGFLSAKSMTCMEIASMMFGVCLVIIGNTGQLFAINEWLTLFPKEAAAPVTALTITATSTTIFFSTCFGIWCLVKRPNVRYILKPDCWALGFLCGFGNAGNGVLIVYATPGTPEILQAFLFSTTIFWTFILMKFANKDSRNYFSPLVILSFLFSLAGIVAGAASQFTSSGGGGGPHDHCHNVTSSVLYNYTDASTGSVDFTSDSSLGSTSGWNETVTLECKKPAAPLPKWWIVVFAGGMLMVAIYNVFVFRFMNKYGVPSGKKDILSGLSNRSFTHSDGEETERLVNSDIRRKKSANDSIARAERRKSALSDSITNKLTMLFVTGITQTIFMWLFTLLDAIPHFGNAQSVPDVYHRLNIGYQCVFGGHPHSICSNNGTYGFLFAFSYVLNYFGTAYLNAYSAAVTSMVTQLSSPFSAFVLLVLPAWNVSKTPINVPESIVAILCLVIAALIYTAWEESTRQSIPDEEGGAPDGLFEGEEA